MGLVDVCGDKPGKAFERRIRLLLELKGVSNLKAEMQFASKKADLYFEVTHFKSKRRYAVECKDHVRTLDQGQVSKIFASYEGLFRDNDITDLLIVSNAELGPSARSYIEKIPQLSYMTEEDLRNDIIDFRAYLSGLKSGFREDQVFHYFVEPQGVVLGPNGPLQTTPTDDNPHLRSLVLKRLETGAQPLVILGAYGIGKTTLAKTLFLDLLEQSEKDSSRPIPIYISLDQMRKEQTLEGLLGALFTSTAPAPGYNFHLFQRMNALGQFVVILDGLDEMRHKLSREEFLYNVDQLAILSNANPCTVLLGRPSAFMGEDEYEYVVHGKSLRPSGFTLGGHKAYEELHIAELTTEQVEELATAFCRWRYPKEPRIVHRVMQMLARQENRILADVARRPVQLMMLLEIFPNLPDRLDLITKSTVYSLFVEELIGRELKKPVGRPFKPADHRLFGRRVAWWLWKQGGSMRIEASAIPAEVLSPLVSKTDDLDTVRRSLVSASFLTTEGGTHLRFPHRSIQEYFVAEEVAALLSEAGEFATGVTASDLSQAFTPEVVDFLSAQLKAVQISELILTLDRLRIVPQGLLGLMRSDGIASKTVEQHFRRTGSPAATWLCVYDVIHKRREDRELSRRLVELIDDRINRYRRDETYSEQQATADVATYLLALAIVCGQGDTMRSFARALLNLQNMTRSANRTARSKARSADTKAHRAPAFATETLRRLQGSASNERIKIDWLYRHLRQASSRQAFVPEWAVNDTVRIPGARMPSALDMEDARELVTFLKFRRS